jgi:hypothetical protein
MLFQIFFLVHVSVSFTASEDLNFTCKWVSRGNLQWPFEANQRNQTTKGSRLLSKPSTTFKNSVDDTAFAFSTTFVFGIRPEYELLVAMVLSLSLHPQEVSQEFFQASGLAYLTRATMGIRPTMLLLWSLTRYTVSSKISMTDMLGLILMV